MSLREWSASRVLWLSLVWIVVTLGLFVWWASHGAADQAQPGNGIGAVSFGIAELLIVIILIIGPPLLLAVLWYLLRRSSTG